MDEENDVDIGTSDDDDDDSISDYIPPGIPVAMAEMDESQKRVHHNHLERVRRDQIKASFNSLRLCVPALSKEKSGKASSTSRAKILQCATDYIINMTNQNNSCVKNIGDIKRQNKELERRVLQAERDAGLVSSPPPVIASHSGDRKCFRYDDSSSDEGPSGTSNGFNGGNKGGGGGRADGGGGVSRGSIMKRKTYRSRR